MSNKYKYIKPDIPPFKGSVYRVTQILMLTNQRPVKTFLEKRPDIFDPITQMVLIDHNTLRKEYRKHIRRIAKERGLKRKLYIRELKKAKKNNEDGLEPTVD